MQKELATIRMGIETQLSEKIAVGMKAGRLTADSDAQALAAHILAAIQGLSTLARDGASREKLLRVVDIALRAWPAAIK